MFTLSFLDELGLTWGSERLYILVNNLNHLTLQAWNAVNYFVKPAPKEREHINLAFSADLRTVRLRQKMSTVCAQVEVFAPVHSTNSCFPPSIVVVPAMKSE